MKNTIIMLACISAFVLTWLSFSLLGYLLSDSGTEFRHVATNGGLIMFMLIFGWIPSVIVGIDLDEKFTAKY